jgi:hypothetical protein
MSERKVQSRRARRTGWRERSPGGRTNQGRGHVGAFSAARRKAPRCFVDQVAENLGRVPLTGRCALRLPLQIVSHTERRNDHHWPGLVLVARPAPIRPGQRANADYAMFVGQVEPGVASCLQVRQHAVRGSARDPVVEFLLPRRIPAREPGDGANIFGNEWNALKLRRHRQIIENSTRSPGRAPPAGKREPGATAQRVVR